MATFMEYVVANRTAKIKADINERWTTRIVEQGFDKKGRAGADEYLTKYGKGIQAGKAALFAVKAELEKQPELALGFWLKAYELETGKQADPGEYKAP